MAESTISSTSSGSAPTGLGIQQRVIYATNSGRWWAFWLSGNKTLATAYSSDGATWTTGATFTTAQSIGTTTTTADGRNLSVAYANIASTDVVHIVMGQTPTSTMQHSHLRATISGTTITFGSENVALQGGAGVPGTFEGGTTTITANHKLVDGADYIDVSSSEEDCEAETWPNADSGTSWTPGSPTGQQVMSTNGSGASTWVGALGSGDTTVFIGDNGDGSPNGWLNLETDVWSGSAWGTVGTALASNLGADADPNDWSAVVLDSTHVMVVWRNSTTNTQYRIASVSGTTLSWNTAAALPTAGLTQPASGTSGFALISDGSANAWLFVIDSGTGNPVKYCKFNTSGAWTSGSWGTWTTFESSSATRTYIGISQQNDGSSNKNYCVYWSESAAIKDELFATVTGGSVNGSATARGVGGVLGGLAGVGNSTAHPAATPSQTLSGSGALGGGLAGSGSVQASPTALASAVLSGMGALASGLFGGSGIVPAVAGGIASFVHGAATLLGIGSVGGGVAGQGSVSPSSAATPSVTLSGAGALLAGLFGGSGIVPSVVGTLGGAIHGAATILGMGAMLLGFGGHGDAQASSAATSSATAHGSGALGTGLSGSGAVNAQAAASTPATFQGTGGVSTGQAGSGALNSSGAATPRVTFEGMGALLSGLFGGQGSLPAPSYSIGGLIVGVFRWLYTAAYNVLQQAFTAQNHQTMVFGGTAYLIFTFVREPDIMVTPNSTIQVVMTAKKYDGTLMSNLATVTATVTFPDGSTSAFALGSGITNTGSGTYTLTYTTKMAGENIEDWVGTDASGNTAEYHNITPVSF